LGIATSHYLHGVGQAGFPGRRRQKMNVVGHQAVSVYGQTITS
jgi:hypothetical protein